jgi:hypothetical protein
MKKSIIALALLAVAALSGCASPQSEIQHSERMYDKQVAAIKDARPIPIFQMTALPGQTIELKGVQQLSVYNPSDSTNKVPEFKGPQNASVEMLKILAPTATTIMGGWFGALTNIVRSTQGPADKDVALQGLNSMTIANPFATPVTPTIPEK